MSDPSGKRGMTEHERRALALLAEMTRTGNLVRPGYFGTRLWSDTRRPTWAFARPAGSVLNRLRSRGLAEWVAPPNKIDHGWRVTPMGVRTLAALAVA